MEEGGLRRFEKEWETEESDPGFQTCHKNFSKSDHCPGTLKCGWKVIW
jgi:hypothetical protein